MQCHKPHVKRWIAAVRRTQTTQADAHSCLPKNGGLHAGLIDLFRNPLAAVKVPLVVVGCFGTDCSTYPLKLICLAVNFVGSLQPVPKAIKQHHRHAIRCLHFTCNTSASDKLNFINMRFTFLGSFPSRGNDTYLAGNCANDVVNVCHEAGNKMSMRAVGQEAFC